MLIKILLRLDRKANRQIWDRQLDLRWVQDLQQDLHQVHCGTRGLCKQGPRLHFETGRSRFIFCQRIHMIQQNWHCLSFFSCKKWREVVWDRFRCCSTLRFRLNFAPFLSWLSSTYLYCTTLVFICIFTTMQVNLPVFALTFLAFKTQVVDRFHVNFLANPKHRCHKKFTELNKLFFPAICLVALVFSCNLFLQFSVSFRVCNLLWSCPSWLKDANVKMF